VYAGRHRVLRILKLPSIAHRHLIVEYRNVEAALRGRQFVAVHMHVASRKITQAAGVIPMQMTEKHDVDVLGRETQFFQISRDALLLRHVRWLHHRSLCIEVAGPHVRRCDLPVVASHVVENSALRSLDEIREDGCVHILPVSAIAGGHQFLVSLGRGQQGPHSQGAGHGVLRFFAESLT
jgi:hypothetical protein